MKITHVYNEGANYRNAPAHVYLDGRGNKIEIYHHSDERRARLLSKVVKAVREIIEEDKEKARQKREKEYIKLKKEFEK